MNNRDDDFVINSDVVLYNTSLTEMHSGGEDGTIQWGRNINNRINNGDVLGTGWFERGWCGGIAISLLLKRWKR